MMSTTKRLVLAFLATFILVTLCAFGYLFLAQVYNKSNGNSDRVTFLSSLVPNVAVKLTSDSSSTSSSSSSSKFSRSFPLIRSSTGRIQGIYVDRLGKKVSTFLGIPYAVPPVRSLRFARPEPYRWRGVFTANKRPPSCMQYKSSIKLPWNENNSSTEESEDCLTLNIWTPDPSLGPSRDAFSSPGNFKKNSSEKAQNNRPVLIWIYGGGFVSGSVNMPEFDGSILAAYTDSVVAMMNYRVGVFGFLNIESSDIQGNMGLYDQVLAIEWIRENADKFGGDPNLITLVGESAGAASIGFHMISPVSRDLFKRSILQSGSPLMPMSLISRSQVKDLASDIIRMTGCSDHSSDQIDYSSIKGREKMVECLKKVPVSALLQAQAVIIRRKDDTTFAPTFFNNDFTSVNPFDAFRTGEELGPQKETLMGFNKDEGSIFMYFSNPTKYPALISSHQKPRTNVTFDEVLQFATRFMKNQNPLTTRNLLNSLYYSHINDSTSNSMTSEGATNSISLFDVTKKHVGEFFVICPTLFAADDLSRHNVSVYMYHFVHRPKSSPWSPWVGSAHYDEVQFVFGIPLIKPSKYTKDEIKLSKKIMNTWASFARTGIPDHQKNFIWPIFNEYNQSFIEISSKSSRVKSGIPNDKCNFWRLTFEVSNSQSSPKVSEDENDEDEDGEDESAADGDEKDADFDQSDPGDDVEVIEERKKESLVLNPLLTPTVRPGARIKLTTTSTPSKLTSVRGSSLSPVRTSSTPSPTTFKHRRPGSPGKTMETSTVASISSSTATTESNYDDTLTTTLAQSNVKLVTHKPMSQEKVNSSKLIPLGRNIALVETTSGSEDDEDDDSSVDYLTPE